MKKKVLAVFSAVMVFTMSSMSVFAASPTAGTAEAPVNTQAVSTSVAKQKTPDAYAAATTAGAGYEVEAVSSSTVEAAAVAVQNNLLNDVASLGTVLDNTVLKAAAADPSKKITAEMLTVVEVSPSTAVKDASGNYVVTLNVSSIKAGDIIAVLHYNGSAWETIVPDSVENGKVTFSTPSLSPISVVKLDVSTVKEAPKTGETMPVAMIVAIIGLAGVCVCGRKYFA